MLFNSQPFVLVFLPLALAGFAVASRGGGRAALAWVAACSLVFYGYWRPVFVLLLLASIGVNFSLGRIVLRRAPDHRRSARRWLILGIGFNLGLLGWFKYAAFGAGALARATGWAIPIPAVFLPLAISFFTFQQIMFLVDGYTGARADVGLLPYAALVSFFPHLIAGPIVRPGEIIPQLMSPAFPGLRRDAVAEGLTVFLLGLAKKLVLADLFARYADVGFDAAAGGHALTLVEAWCAVLAFALQIYFDFSGYSDMAIGLARMFNVRFPENFASPYQARDIAEFWRRWHITLSRFLRDYLYIPLGGNRRGGGRRMVNLMTVMLLGGLWHGAAWTFVLWGGLHGTYLMVHAGWRRLGFPLWRPASHAITLLAVLVAWVPFRADRIGTAWAMLRAMAGGNGLALPQMVVAAFPPLAWIARPVAVLPWLGDARTLSLPEVAGCLAVGWFVVLCLPNLHALSARARAWSVTASFALAMQALFFAPNVSPFLYFRF